MIRIIFTLFKNHQASSQVKGRGLLYSYARWIDASIYYVLTRVVESCSYGNKQMWRASRRHIHMIIVGKSFCLDPSYTYDDVARQGEDKCPGEPRTWLYGQRLKGMRKGLEVKVWYLWHTPSGPLAWQALHNERSLYWVVVPFSGWFRYIGSYLDDLVSHSC